MNDVVPFVEDFGVIETIIGAKIDDFHPQFEEFGRHGGGGGVRQAAKNGIDAALRKIFRSKVFAANIVLSRQRGMNLCDRACVFATRHGDDLDKRMAPQKFQ